MCIARAQPAEGSLTMTRSAPDRRRRELARIHILAQQLGMSRDQYEAVLWTVARVHSSRELDGHGRQQVIQHMERRAKDLGVAVDRRKKVRERVGDDRAPMLGKVLRLLGDRDEAYALGVLQQMFGKAAPAQLEWASHEQLRALIAALSKDRQRRGDA